MTKSTETEIAILQTQMTEVKTSLEVIKADQQTNFQALALKIDNLSNTPSEITVLTERVSKLEKAQGRQWIFQTMSAGMGALLFFLVQYTLTH
jgi:hypothetical protein